MKLELIVSAFGHSPHLVSCLRSLVEQDAVQAGVAAITLATSTPCLELETAARCFGVRYVVNPERASIGADWNFALACGRAPLAAICHQDDTYHPRFASAMLALWEREPRLLMASSSYEKVDSEGRAHRSVVLTVKRFLMWRAFGHRDTQPGPDIRRRMLSWGNPVCCSSVVFNKAVLGDFEFDTSWQSNLDWEAWERIAAQPGLVGYIPEPLVRYRVHSGSTTTKLIANHARPLEDLLMLCRFWPATLARAWMVVYSQAYRSHRAAAAQEPLARRRSRDGSEVPQSKSSLTFGLTKNR